MNKIGLNWRAHLVPKRRFQWADYGVALHLLQGFAGGRARLTCHMLCVNCVDAGGKMKTRGCKQWIWRLGLVGPSVKLALAVNVKLVVAYEC